MTALPQHFLRLVTRELLERVTDADDGRVLLEIAGHDGATEIDGS